MGQRLGSFIAHGVVDSVNVPNIVKGGVEVRKIEAHLHPSLEDADFRQFLGAMISDLGLRGFEFAGGVPGSTTRVVEPSPRRARMAISRHDDGRLWPSHPFTFRQAVQHA